MEFGDSPEEAAFRAEARAWLEAHAEPKSDTGGSIGVMGEVEPDVERAQLDKAKQWQRTLYEGGWAGITWPKEYGGRGGTSMQAIIFNQEQSKLDVPPSPFAVGLGMAGPTIIHYGTPEQKERHLGPMLRGDEVWCQLFSEPGAGSDLAGLSTRAVRDGDEYVVNGQKVWTSGAHQSDFGILLARTDFDAPKHRGITYFTVSMRTPGIEVRPLRQLTGGAHFNEVFLTDVRVPAGNVIGGENDGWRVANTTLTNERTLIGGGGGGESQFAAIVQMARKRGATSDPRLRNQLADAFIRYELLKYLGWRVQTAISKGQQPGPESSVLKLAHTRNITRTADLVMELQGMAGTLAKDDADDGGQWQLMFLSQWASRLGGGTDQVQRNIIGERVLRLPSEPRTDRDVPFRELGAAPK